MNKGRKQHDFIGTYFLSFVIFYSATVWTDLEANIATLLMSGIISNGLQHLVDRQKLCLL